MIRLSTGRTEHKKVFPKKAELSLKLENSVPDQEVDVGLSDLKKELFGSTGNHLEYLLVQDDKQIRYCNILFTPVSDRRYKKQRQSNDFSQQQKEPGVAARFLPL